MKLFTTIIIFGSLLLMHGGMHSELYGDNMGATLKKNYGDVIDDIITRCMSKTEMLYSGSQNIRRDAFREIVKGAYVRNNKAELEQYLSGIHASLNPDRISYHINQLCKKSVKAKQIYELLSQEDLFRKDRESRDLYIEIAEFRL